MTSSPSALQRQHKPPAGGAGPVSKAPLAPGPGGAFESGSDPRTLGPRTTKTVLLPDDAVREGWAEFLSRYQWDVFATLTYRGSAWAEEKVYRNFKSWLYAWQLRTAIERGLCTEQRRPKLDAYNRTIGCTIRYSGRWYNKYRKGRAFPVYVVGIEPQKSGKLHAHAIIKWSDSLPDLYRGTGHHLWTGPMAEGGFDHGISRIGPPRCQGDVAGYVSKYVVKGGDLYLSPSFDAARLVAA